MRRRLVTSRLARGIACGAALVLPPTLLGCATNANETGVTQAAKTVPAPAPAPAPPPSPPGGAAKDAVRSYYAAINADRYAAAWSHFAPALRASQGGFDAWREGYANTSDTQLLSLRTIKASSSRAIEEIELAADATDACGEPVSQTFSGTWTLVNQGGSFVGSALDVQQTGGDTVITDSSECTPPPAPVEPPTSSSGPGCDPNYVGACLDPSSPDYDCAGGSGNGPDYTGPVQVVGSDPYGLDADGDGYACEDS